MFTGIIEELGVVRKISPKGNVSLLEINAKEILSGVKVGDSVAVNGVCLTVISLGLNRVSFEVMDITLKNTNLGQLKPGQQVNLERSLKVGDRVSGHFVLGHIDCLGTLRRKCLRQGIMELDIAVPYEFMRYCLPRGSVSLDGISLTLAKVSANIFTVCIIPHTFKNTTLNFKGPSDKLNVEFDILAKNIPFNPF
ncbi:MAG: riboflavin synthase [Candidatus Omnitrophica bacterium]|jgi:riboflavin synthase|nr:riboflavin synthase [Candidatus Omnitrophota bacterium]MDD5660996.1 riboflavin synthase [Candidatus Omnitrophota bacterium]